MGASQSAVSNPKSAPITATPPVHAEGAGITALRFPTVIQGLAGSGKTAIQDLLQVTEAKKLEVDGRFLTTPQIYGTEWGSNNFPGYGNRKTMDKTVWAYGGRGSFRARWSTAAYATKSIIFTVDSTDHARLVAPEGFTPLPKEFVAAYAHRSKEEQEEIFATLQKTQNVKSLLHKLLGMWEVVRKPLLILATKQDLPGAMTVREIAEALELSTLKKRDWRVAGCDALTGEGVQESVDWLHYIVEHPTDWTLVDKAEQAESQEKGVQEAQWAAVDIKRKIEEGITKARDARLAAGDVLLAPPIFHTNGERWSVTEEQRKVFVVAPITPDPAAAAEKEEDVVLANPLVNVDLAERLLHTIRIETSNDVPAETNDTLEIDSNTTDVAQVEGLTDKTIEGELNAKENSTSRAGETNESISLRASTNVENETDSLDALVLKVKKDTASLKIKKAAKKFEAVSGTHLVLPAVVLQPPTEMVKAPKKHWYSRTKMVPAHTVENIHRPAWGGIFDVDLDD